MAETQTIRVVLLNEAGDEIAELPTIDAEIIRDSGNIDKVWLDQPADKLGLQVREALIEYALDNDGWKGESAPATSDWIVRVDTLRATQERIHRQIMDIFDEKDAEFAARDAEYAKRKDGK